MDTSFAFHRQTCNYILSNFIKIHALTTKVHKIISNMLSRTQAVTLLATFSKDVHLSVQAQWLNYFLFLTWFGSNYQNYDLWFH